MYNNNVGLAAALLADEHRRQEERRARRAAIQPESSGVRHSAFGGLLSRIRARHSAGSLLGTGQLDVPRAPTA